ncbi:predicted protein [Phaeodactylum tricornutum CCAP 1055/1]|jgi:diadenosine tetraphosphate (Ap4A) HIT family hydrolase|uniref:HIT domain-containing protein n=2 Tax=Phaeodactylum tricornutum TaxID=2850 RepID=B7G8J9_PHATC|nr:predicted protein [Phaeodactylum tricornutum CCAP 1055/1]EEC45185.1 predicted protein [Phaeodactylum tricornutum CCAP 1055/1]|eukprot:XP_002183485.1 predicted protein [Phaeodactylum tricornutum CCAP 1055/1]
MTFVYSKAILLSLSVTIRFIEPPPKVAPLVLSSHSVPGPKRVTTRGNVRRSSCWRRMLLSRILPSALAMFTLFAISRKSLTPLPEQTLSAPAKVREYHTPPQDVHYGDNTSVFGRILNGELPASTFAESNDLFAFEDAHPQAPLHALIISKRFIGSVFDLELSDLNLVRSMRDMAYELIRERYPEALSKKDYILCFHIPPFNSVDHIHLHVLAPASRMQMLFRFVKYNVRTRWCTDVDTVIRRLEQGEAAVPYRNPRPSTKST